MKLLIAAVTAHKDDDFMVFAAAIRMFGTALRSMSKSHTEFKRPPIKVTSEINSRKR